MRPAVPMPSTSADMPVNLHKEKNYSNFSKMPIQVKYVQYLCCANNKESRIKWIIYDNPIKSS